MVSRHPALHSDDIYAGFQARSEIEVVYPDHHEPIVRALINIEAPADLEIPRCAKQLRLRISRCVECFGCWMNL